MIPDYNATITEAEGYLELGLFTEAWEETDSLPPEWKTRPEVMRIRAKCALAWCRTDMAAALASVLSEGREADREVAAEIYRMLAVEDCRAGALDSAAAFVRKAIALHPGSRLAVLDHPILSQLL